MSELTTGKKQARNNEPSHVVYFKEDSSVHYGYYR